MRGFVATAMCAVALAACTLPGAGDADSFATWSDTALAPDPALAAIALSDHSACRGSGEEPVRILLQDRRTDQTAAFLMLGPTTFGGCVVTKHGAGSAGSSGPSLEPMARLLTIDENGESIVNSEALRDLGGRVVPAAASVIVELQDGRTVVASVQGGYWLAWWPTRVPAQRVVARNAAGLEIATELVAG